MAIQRWAENFAVLRHLTLNLLCQKPSTKSLPGKRLACAFNPEYLLEIVISVFVSEVAWMKQRGIKGQLELSLFPEFHARYITVRAE